MTRVLLVTGMSGAGRTSALKALEDLGFEAVDNLPVTLIGNLVRPGDRLERDLAIGIDCRSRAFDPERLRLELEPLRGNPELDVSLVFLDAEDEVLRRRFTETRRRHPVAMDRPVTDGIRLERQLIAPLREEADLLIDTSELAPRDLSRMLAGHFAPKDGGLSIQVVSFAYREGLPREADLVFDARFLANPYWDLELRPMSGLDAPVERFVAADPAYGLLMERLLGLLEPLLPCFQREGKSYLTVAVGCTGGQHRSVLVAEALARHLGALGWPVSVRHRDVRLAQVTTATERSP
jgi:RNase adapter protein RapZ